MGAGFMSTPRPAGPNSFASPAVTKASRSSSQAEVPLSFGAYPTVSLAEARAAMTTRGLRPRTQGSTSQPGKKQIRAIVLEPLITRQGSGPIPPKRGKAHPVDAPPRSGELGRARGGRARADGGGGFASRTCGVRGVRARGGGSGAHRRHDDRRGGERGSGCTSRVLRHWSQRCDEDGVAFRKHAELEGGDADGGASAGAASSGPSPADLGAENARLKRELDRAETERETARLSRERAIGRMAAPL